MTIKRRDRETYISVDVETSGPIPGDFSMLSIGMTVVGREDEQGYSFYRELKPHPGAKDDPVAIKYTGGLNSDWLEYLGTDIEEALLDAEAWVASVTEPGTEPVFVAWPAHFDWMWVQWYFMHYLGHTPFGTGAGRALDMRSFAMGRTGLGYREASTRTLGYMGITTDRPHTHNALDDAREQSDIFFQLFERGRDMMRWVAASLRDKEY